MARMNKRLLHAYVLGVLTRLDDALVAHYLAPTTVTWTAVLACKLQLNKLLIMLSEENSRFEGQISKEMIEVKQIRLFGQNMEGD